jgi:CubicO group peptidase (beta-lactamase class C family)
MLLPLPAFLLILVLIYIICTVSCKELGQHHLVGSTDHSPLLNKATLIRFSQNTGIDINTLTNSAVKQVNITFIEQLMAAAHIPGLSMRVVSGNSSSALYQQALGYTDIVVKLPLSNETVFNLASITKTITCICVMQLVEQGLLDLDTDINKYLLANKWPAINNPYRPSDVMTLRHLLTHTSSIGSASNVNILPNDMLLSIPLKNYVYQQLLPAGNLYNATSWLNAPVGTAFHYANAGIALVGLLIEAVTHISYEQYSVTNVLDPLEMATDSHWTYLEYVAKGQLSLLSSHYSFNITSEEYQWDFPMLGYSDIELEGANWVKLTSQYCYLPRSAGQLRSSAKSLSNHLLMLIQGGTFKGKQIISPKSVSLIETIQYPRISNWGLIYFYTQFDGHRWLFGHDGALIGARNLMFMNKQTGIGVVLLSNGDATGSNDYQDSLVDTALYLITNHLFDVFENQSSLQLPK